VSVRRGLAWMSVSQGGFFILQFAGSVILARLLTPYEMGVYAVAAAVFGLSGFIVREHALTPQLLASTFTVNTALAVLLSAAVAGLSAFGGAFLHEAGVKRVMLVLAALPLLGALEFLPSANLERQGLFKSIALVGVARMVVYQVTTVALAFAGFSYMSIAYGNLAGALVSLVGFNLAGRQHASVRLSLAEWRRITRFGLQMMAISGVNEIGGRGSDFILGRIRGLGALGLYSRASSLNGLLWDNIHVVIGRVVFVDFAGQRRQGISLRASYLRTVDVVTALLWPAFAGFAVTAGPLIVAVYGQKWAGAAPPLSMLSTAAIVLVSITMTWEVFVVCEETARQSRFEIYLTTAGFVMFAAGAFISLTAAAASRIAYALLSFILYRPHLQRMTDTTGRDFVLIYLRSGILTLVAVAPAAMVMTLYHWSPTRTPLATVLATIVAGLAAWVIALRLLRHPLFEELRRFSSPALRKLASVKS
jgi:O-antigen/teichoic acid export membrane protein